MKGIAVLGSTGSIGTSTLKIVEQFPDEFRVVSMAAGKNFPVLRDQIRKFRPAFVSIQQDRFLPELSREFPKVAFGTGKEGVDACVLVAGVDIVVVGIVGLAAMSPALTAVRSGKVVALATKEVLVVAGSLFRNEIASSTSVLIPVDSEHSALFQLLQGRERSEVTSIVLTASGGPFLHMAGAALDRVTPEMAIQHPNWRMGPKISVDSATLMNKGLELIEAHFLFDFSEKDIEVWLHPQSIVHGAICLRDNSCLAQLCKPDMRCSIGYAMSYPKRLPDVIPKFGFSDLANLEFFEPDVRQFPALKLAREALNSGASHLVVLNAANDIAVESFLRGEIEFRRLPPLPAWRLRRIGQLR